jgi:hypothetical protein
MSFQITPLGIDIPASALRVTADKKPGYPCRVSLEDAEPGEQVYLFHYEHQPADTPFRASHAIYVRHNATPAIPKPNEVPAMLLYRILSLRAFDHQGMLRDADLAEGDQIPKRIEKMLADSEVAYIHLHFAKPGCYAARADRIVQL